MMTDIQCPSCQTRYRIDERVLPEDTPTFKCSRCGHVFSAEPRQSKGSAPTATRPKAETPQPAQPEADARPSASVTTGSAAPKDVGPKDAVRKDSAPREALPREAAPKDGTTRTRADSTATNPSATPRAKPAPEAPAKSPAEPSATASARRGDLLRRLFEGGAAEAENLTFDFHDEKSGPGDFHEETPDPGEKAEFGEEVDEDQWEVGDAASGFGDAPDGAEEGDLHAASPAAALLRRAAAARAAADAAIEPDPSVAFLYKGGKVHAAGFFIGLFLLVLLGFGLFSLIICGAPMASAELLSGVPGVGDRFAPPIMPARLVALTDVHATYKNLKDNRAALVISGSAQNVGTAPLNAVQVQVSLLPDAQSPLKTQTVYCGNNLSAEMIDEMTPRELEFFQKLEPPKNFVLARAQSSAFALVIIDPPPGVTKFQVSVAKAQPATDDMATPKS
jgi:predicted Zn finger-like uncharacterized protein